MEKNTKIIDMNDVKKTIEPRINNDEGYFEIKEDGIYLVTPPVNKKNDTTRLLVSSLIYIHSRLYSKERQYYLVKWWDGRELKERYVVSKNIIGEGYKENDDFNYLFNNGLTVSPKCKPLLNEYLKSAAKTAEMVDATEKAGWDLEENHFYSSGYTTNPNKKFIGSSGFTFSKKGNELDYIDKISNVFAENPLVFACCAYSASAFLLPFLHNETNQILQINGMTSKGKSTVLLFASSMFTAPRFESLNATTGSILSTLKSSNHHPILFDEVAEAHLKPEDARKLVYSMANGTERGRLRKNDTINDYVTTSIDTEEKYKYTVLIAGESSLLDGVTREDTGLDARYVEILIPESISLWEGITDTSEIETLVKFISANYGFVTDYLINRIKNYSGELVIQYENKLAEIREDLGETSSLMKRKVRILAYTYVLMSVLSDYFYDGDDEVAISVVNNAFEVFKSAITYELQKTKENPYKQALAHIQSHLMKYLEDETSLEGNQIQLNQKYGSYKITSTHKEIFIIPSKFKDVCSKLDLDERMFMQYLKDSNLLVTDKGELTKKLKKDGDINRVRYYYIKVPVEYFLDDEEKDEVQKQENEIKPIPIESLSHRNIPDIPDWVHNTKEN